MAYQRGKTKPYVGRDIEVEGAKTGRDYVKDGKVYSTGKSASVMVTAESDLTQLEGYAPGTIAYTAGFGSMWQLAADDTWVALGGE